MLERLAAAIGGALPPLLAAPTSLVFDYARARACATPIGIEYVIVSD